MDLKHEIYVLSGGGNILKTEKQKGDVISKTGMIDRFVSIKIQLKQYYFFSRIHLVSIMVNKTSLVSEQSEELGVEICS